MAEPSSFRVNGIWAGGNVAGSITFTDNTATLGWADVYLSRDAANTLAQRNGTSAQAFRLYQTYTDASNNAYLGVNINNLGGTNYWQFSPNANGTGSYIGLLFSTNGSARWKVELDGHFVPQTNNALTVGDSSARAANVYSVLGNFSGDVTLAGAIASSGVARFAGSSMPGTGAAAAEVYYSGGAWFQSYDRTGASYGAARLNGSSAILTVSGTDVLTASASAVTVSAAATMDVSTSFRNTNATNGQTIAALQTLTELTTIAAAASTDTTIQMPAGAVILGVAVRVTTVIPTAATFTVGDSGSAARFSTAAVSTAANSTDAGTKAGAYYNASALSVRITPNVQPADNTGRVRVVIYYYTVTPPTS